MANARVLLLGGSGLVGSCARDRWASDLTLDAPTHAELDVLDDAALADRAPTGALTFRLTS